MSENRRDTLTMVPVEYDPFGVDAPQPAPQPQWVPQVNYDPGLPAADPMKIGPGPESAAERALREGIGAFGGWDIANAITSGRLVYPQLQRGETGYAVGNALAALAQGGMGAMGMVPAGGKPVRAAEPARNALRAYHGSPHDFDAFDIAKIGTGEGHQAYGRGLYFADAEPVAETYRPGHVTHEMVGPEGTVLESGSRNRIGLTMGDQLRDVVQPEMKYLGNSIGALWAAGTPLTPENVARQAWGLDRKAAVPEELRQVPDWRKHVQEAIDRTKPVLDQHRIEEKRMGRMYEVDLKVDPDHLLDWDKPVAGNSEHVRKALDALGMSERERAYASGATEDLTGRDVIMKLEQEGDPAAAMERMRDAGIKGIRYLDQNSRPRMELEKQLEYSRNMLEDAKLPPGSKNVQSLWQDKIDRIEDQLKRMPPATYNYVMNDDKAIDIVRKYGLAALIGGGAAAAAGSEVEAAPRPKASTLAAGAVSPEQEKTLRSRLAAPAIRGEQPLFPDIGYERHGYGEGPAGVPQVDLPRKQPGRDLPERLTRLAGPETLARMNALAEEGMNRGAGRWYNFEPLRAKFHEHLGPTEGEAGFRDYINMVGASTNRSTPLSNYRDASYYYGLQRRGEPIPEAQYLQPGERLPKDYTADPQTGQLFTPSGKPMKNPQPYGHLAQDQHRANALMLMEGGQWDTRANPKPPSFIANQLGNMQPYTLDTVGVRDWGMRNTKGEIIDDPPKQQYQFIERLAQGEAEKMGIPTAWWQAAHWVGGMDPTRIARERAKLGHGSGAMSGLDFLEARIRHTANVRGERPEETLKKFIVEGIPILSVGGAGVVLLPVDHDPFAEQ